MLDVLNSGAVWPADPLATSVRSLLMADQLTRAQLVHALAQVSHDTYNHQALREGKKSEPTSRPTQPDHDLERAEDTVRELERLGIWPTA